MPPNADSQDLVRALLDEVRIAGQATPIAMKALELLRAGDVDVEEAAETLAAAICDGADADADGATDEPYSHAIIVPLITTGALALFTPRIVDAALRIDNTLERIFSAQGDAFAAACHVTAAAASSPSLRTLIAGTQAVQRRLEFAVEEESVTKDNASAALLRIKLAIRSSDAPGTPLDLPDADVEKLARGLAAYIGNSGARDANAPSIFSFDAEAAARADALESLYYLAATDKVKETLSRDEAFLGVAVDMLAANAPRKTLFPARDGGEGSSTSLYSDNALDKEAHSPASLEYLIVSIFALISSYPPPKHSESHQIEALRRTALRRGDDAPDAADAAARCRRLVAAGVAAAIAAVVSRTRLSDATELRRQLGSVLCSLVTEQDRAQRGKLLADGAAGALLHLAAPAYGVITDRNDNPVEWQPLRAIARLSISSDPSLMYGGGIARGVPYCAALLLAKSTSLLDRFEGALALTNLASASPAMAHTVAIASFRGPDADTELKNVGSAIPALFMQYDTPLLRRALIELLCNLVQDDDVFAEWSGEAAVDADDKKRAAGESLPALPDKDDATIRLHDPRGRLQLLASLCQVDAEADRINVEEARAAAGALAMLSASGAACEHILALPSRLHGVIAQLVLRSVSDDKLSKDDEMQFALRGLAIVSSLVQYVRWLESNKDSRSRVRRRVRDPTGALQRSGLLQVAAQRAISGAQAMMAGLGTESTGLEAQVTSLAVDVMRDAQQLMK
ncbi:SWI5-dependent HO expression protein 4 [Malassezia cuniculi]|uniref:SWI5-dependent HO expression protein 4 n=1 Tax=Malassezia cuniculi TaxID=948313 RepID=A0AAF0EU83_9BASI|nr:SWI5-dependent HO expression protein 4 [Malassezia cuniculi]